MSSMDFLIRSFSTLHIYFWCVVLVVYWINEYSWMCRKPVCIIVISTRVIKLCKLHPHISTRPYRPPPPPLNDAEKMFFFASKENYLLQHRISADIDGKWERWIFLDLLMRWSHFLTWPSFSWSLKSEFSATVTPQRVNLKVKSDIYFQPFLASW